MCAQKMRVDAVVGKLGRVALAHPLQRQSDLLQRLIHYRGDAPTRQAEIGCVSYEYST